MYEKKVFDYAKLSGILRKAATLFEKVISSNEDGLRFEPEYFRVGFYGQGFPLFLRVIFHILNKTDIHSGFKTANQLVILKVLLFLRMYRIQNHEILNFLETFRSHPGKSLKVHFNLLLRILAHESRKKAKISSN